MNIESIFPAKPLPWEDLSGPVFYARDIRVRKKWVKRGCFLLCLFLIAGGILTKYRVACVFGILYILVLLTDKKIAVTERGIETFYQMRVTTHYELWTWDTVDMAVRGEQLHPDFATLYFSRGDRVKKLFFQRADAQEMMERILKEHRNVKVADEEKKRVPRYYGRKEKKSGKN